MTDPGPDLTKPGVHWSKIIRAVALDRKISLQEAAEYVCTLYSEKFHKAIKESI